MKTLFTMISLLSTMTYCAQLNVTFHYHHNGIQKDIINTMVSLSSDQTATLEIQDIKLTFSIKELDDKVAIHTSIYDNETLLAEPTLISSWDKSAKIVMNEITNNSLDSKIDLEITATKN